MLSATYTLTQELRKRLPIVDFPSRRQVLCLALGKAGVIKNDFGPIALLRDCKFRNRVNARIPVDNSPSLDDSFVGHKFDVPSHDNAAEKRERASCFTADLCRRLFERNAGLLRRNDLHNLVELLSGGKVLPLRVILPGD